MRTTTCNGEAISLEQAVGDYRKNGYIKIDSSLLNEVVYLARMPWAARRIPDKSLAVYYPEEIARLTGLPPAHIRVMHEAKKVFSGEIGK